MTDLGVAVYDVSIADELDALTLDFRIFLPQVLHNPTQLLIWLQISHHPQGNLSGTFFDLSNHQEDLA